MYLFETDADVCKVGFSKDPAKRKAWYGRLPFRLWLAHQLPVGTQAVEWEMHAALKPWRVRGEWYRLPTLVADTIRGTMGARWVDSLPGLLRRKVEPKPEVGKMKLRPWFDPDAGWQGWVGAKIVTIGVTDPAAADVALAAYRRHLFPE